MVSTVEEFFIYIHRRSLSLVNWAKGGGGGGWECLISFHVAVIFDPCSNMHNTASTTCISYM